MLMKMFCAVLLYFVAAGCVYTDAYGVVPADAYSGKIAIDKIGAAAAYSYVIAQNLIHDHARTNPSAGGYNGLKQDAVTQSINNRLAFNTARGYLGLQEVRNYKRVGVDACEATLKSDGILFQYFVFLFFYDTSKSWLPHGLDSVVNANAGLIMALDTCQVESTGRLIDLGPLSF